MQNRFFPLLLTVLLLFTACTREENQKADSNPIYGPIEAGYFEKRKISFFDTQVSVQNLFMEDDCFCVIGNEEKIKDLQCPEKLDKGE